MNRPLESRPIPHAETPLYNSFYQDLGRAECDTTTLWGTEADVSPLKAYLQKRNADADVLISPAHVLVRAVGLALRDHPQFNCRLVGRRLHRFKDANVLVPAQRQAEGEADVFLLKSVDCKSLAEIAAEMWRWKRGLRPEDAEYERERRIYRKLPRAIGRALLRLRLWAVNNFDRRMTPLNERLRGSPVLVNYLGFAGAPPLRSYKPSRFPVETQTLNVTLGPAHPTPVAVDGEVQIHPVAPLFVRSDHRVVDAVDLARFAATVRDYIQEPETVESSDSSPATDAADAHVAPLVGSR